ncbi:MAG: spermidine/putrescine ABC transporter substrate-binding protein [Oscillospiraceae bacterium]|jgi:spermidine/putrescine transport system substrate-binding protein/spermidine/putrescine transport system permease protein|nr:spermidine/putrescine ABC transporter substrate-binding protein [Oscillospiraceae bacterium]
MKKLITTLLALTLLFAAASCGKSSDSGAPKKGGELNVFVWTEYMPQSVFDAFTKETGIKVNVSTYSSNEDMLSKVKGGNEGIYDIVVPSDYMVKMMTAEGLLAPLDLAAIPNLTNIDAAYLNQSFDPGNKYSVPYMGGLAGLVVNGAKADEVITGYEQIFSPKYANSIVALDDFRAVIGMTAKSLGYSLNTVDDAELAAVDAKLDSLKANIKLLDSDSPKSAMLSGETSIGFMWNAEIAICLQESGDFYAVFPDEGCYLFLDNLSILKGAKNPDAATQFLNFVLRPDVSKLVSDEFPYLNPNAAAVEMLPDSYKSNLASNIDPAVIANGEYVQDIGSDVEKYDTLWTKFVK